jgi:hypothetical protein
MPPGRCIENSAVQCRWLTRNKTCLPGVLENEFDYFWKERLIKGERTPQPPASDAAGASMERYVLFTCTS